MGTVKTTTNSDGSTTSSKLRFSYDADGKVVAVNYNGNYYYYLRNAQNDIVKLIDKTGATVVEYAYDSWGKLLSTSGSLASTLGKNNPFRYRGYVYDEETGFYYLQSRYYNPEVGRFISSDVLLSTGQGVLGHNAYAYCLNNPVNMGDGCGFSAVPVYQHRDLSTFGAGAGALGLIGMLILTIEKAKPDVGSPSVPKSKEKDDPKDDAVYYGAYIDRNNQFYKVTGPMDFITARAWAFATAEAAKLLFDGNAISMSRNTALGLYTYENSDAFLMAQSYSLETPRLEWHGSGEYAHYHAAENKFA